jgi:hypothetical protein
LKNRVFLYYKHTPPPPPPSFYSVNRRFVYLILFQNWLFCCELSQFLGLTSYGTASFKITVPKFDILGQLYLFSIFLNQLRLFQNFSFWNSLPDLKRKTRHLTGFSTSLSKTNQVLEQAQLAIDFISSRRYEVAEQAKKYPKFSEKQFSD